ncbi:MAG TPA: hypothetical protein VFR34_02475 [Paracoccaceae bacterium]|nr:hypothetical protein [Paracoccaceae bacterium]
MLRVTGFLFLAAGIVFALMDWQMSGRSFAALRFRDIGTLWAEWHRDSLLLLQPALERHVAVWLWDPVMLTVLLAPAAPVLFLIGLVLLLLGRRRSYG